MYMYYDSFIYIYIILYIILGINFEIESLNKFSFYNL